MSAPLRTRFAPWLLFAGCVLVGVAMWVRTPEPAVKRVDGPAAEALRIPARPTVAVLDFHGAELADAFEDSLRRRLRATAHVDGAALPASVDVVLHGRLGADGAIVHLSDAHTATRIEEWWVAGDAARPVELAAAVAAKVRPKLGL